MILPASAPVLPTVLSSCRRWAAAVSSSGMMRSMRGLIFPGGEPAVDVFGRRLLLVGGGVEHGEAEQVAVFVVERADGKWRPGIAAGHEDHAAARGQQRYGQFEVRLAKSFPPDVDAIGSEFFHAGRYIFFL